MEAVVESVNGGSDIHFIYLALADISDNCSALMVTETAGEEMC